MRRPTTIRLLVLAAFLGMVPLASAQYFPPGGPAFRPATPPTLSFGYGRPALSPYLNLLRGGDPAANYYLGVVPERIARDNFQAIQGSLRTLDRQVTSLEGEVGRIPGEERYIDVLPPTGHKTYYGSPQSKIGQSPPAVKSSLGNRAK